MLWPSPCWILFIFAHKEGVNEFTMKFITPRYMHQNAIFFPCEKSFVVNFAIAMIEFAAQKLGMQNLVEIFFWKSSLFSGLVFL